MPRARAGQIYIGIDARTEKFNRDVQTANNQLALWGKAGHAAGAEVAKGMVEAHDGARRFMIMASEVSAVAVKYYATTQQGAAATENLVNAYRGIRLALSPTPFTAATIAIGAMTVELMKLTNARAKIIEQQALFAATSRMPIGAVDRLDTITGIAGGDVGRSRGLFTDLSSRVQSSRLSVETGLGTLGVSASGLDRLDPAMLGQIARGFANIEDPAKRAAAAVAIFGADKAAEALHDLDARFADASDAAAKYGVVMDETARNHIYKFRHDLQDLKNTFDFTEVRAGLVAFGQGVAVVFGDMYWNLGRLIDRADEWLAKYAPILTIANQQIDGPPELHRTGPSLATGDMLWGQSRNAAAAQSQTLEGLRKLRDAKGSEADSAFAKLSADDARKFLNPGTGLSADERLLLAVQQQSAAALQKSYADRVKVLEDADEAEKKAAEAAKERERDLGALVEKRADQYSALSSKAIQVFAHLDAEIEKRQKLGKIDAERLAVLTDIARVEAGSALMELGEAVRNAPRAKALRDERTANLLWRSAGEIPLPLIFEAGTPQRGELGGASRGASLLMENWRRMVSPQSMAKDSSIDIANIQNRAGHEQRMAGINSRGDEAALAEKVYQITLREIDAERNRLLLHSTAAEMEEHDAQLKERRLQADEAREERIATYQRQRMSTAREGVAEFFQTTRAQAITTGQIVNQALNSGVDRFSQSIARVMTGESGGFGQAFKDIGRDMVGGSVKGLMQRGIGALGNRFGLGGLVPADGSKSNPFYVVIADGAAGLGGEVGKLAGKAGGVLSSLFGALIPHAAGGPMSPDTAYIVGEQGFEVGNGNQLMSHARSLDFLKDATSRNGGAVYNIDARGADLGASNRIARAIESAHTSAVSTSIHASAQRAMRTPRMA